MLRFMLLGNKLFWGLLKPLPSYICMYMYVVLIHVINFFTDLNSFKKKDTKNLKCLIFSVRLSSRSGCWFGAHRSS